MISISTDHFAGFACPYYSTCMRFAFAYLTELKTE